MTNRYIHKDGRSLAWNKSKELWEVYNTNGIVLSTHMDIFLDLFDHEEFEPFVLNNFSKFPWDFVEWEFYFVQLLDRSKSGGNNKTRCVKSYHIDSQKYLDKKMEEMITIAKATNSRIYVHPARRSKQKVALELLSYIADTINTNTLDRVYRAFETATGRNTGTEKMWVLDFDSRDKNLLQQHVEAIKLCKPYIDPEYILETVSWYHVIYKGGFNRIEYNKFTNKEWLTMFDIHTNNPCLLYAY